MKLLDMSRGRGRTRVSLLGTHVSGEVVVSIFNANQHVGAVAVGEFDHNEARASVSVITRLGHKDDAIGRDAAYAISKATRRPCCVVAGVHVDDITAGEIAEIVANARGLVDELIKALPSD